MGYSGGDRGVRVLLDTNMLLLVADGINVFQQIEDLLETKPEYIVIKPVVEELEKLAEKGKPSIRRKARFALMIMEKYCRVVEYEYPHDISVDELILEYASSHNNVVVATSDRELRRKLRGKGIPTIFLREEKMMVEAEGIDLI